MKSRKALEAAVLVAWTLSLLTPGYGAGDGGHIVYPAGAGSPGPAVFSHRIHGEGKAGYACGQCHASEKAKPASAGSDAIHRETSCGSCHDGKSKGPRGQSTAAPVQDCAACHLPAAHVVIKMNRMDPVGFSHIRHMGADSKAKVSKPAGFSCSDCHSALFERVSKAPIGMEVPHESGGCAECHTGKERADGMPAAFAADTRCLKCHKPPE